MRLDVRRQFAKDRIADLYGDDKFTNQDQSMRKEHSGEVPVYEPSPALSSTVYILEKKLATAADKYRDFAEGTEFAAVEVLVGCIPKHLLPNIYTGLGCIFRKK